MLNPLATMIVDIFRARGMDEAYLQSKAARLSDLENSDVLFWATHALDANAKVELAKRLGVTKDQLEATSAVLLKVNNL